MEEEIKSEFEKASFSVEEETPILPTLLSYCINYKLSAADLVSSWVVYYLNRQLSGKEVKNTYMDGFLSYLQTEEKEKQIKEEPNVYSSNNIDTLLSNKHEHAEEENLLSSPIAKNQEPYLNSSTKKLNSSSIHITPFGQRTTKFTSQFVFNSNNLVKDSTYQNAPISEEDEIIKRVKPSQRCSLTVIKSQPKSGYRIHDITENRVNFLENRINNSAKKFTASKVYGNLTDPTMASEEEIFAVGMVVCDAEGHLNEKSILLQCSVEQSMGQCVRLDLRNLTKFSLFPGQVIGIKGRNPSGHYLVASQVFDHLPLEENKNIDSSFAPRTKKRISDEDDSPLRVLSTIIASGPFTTSDNLLFEPLDDLLAYARRKQPQLVILMGPFVDCEHPEIKKGIVDRSFQDIFHVEIIRRIQDFTQYMGSSVRVVLVPSIRDAHHDLIFPQPAFDLNLTEVSTQITCLANPNIFSSNEIIFGCCNVDIMKQLSGEEISRNPPNSQSDRIGRLASHLLNQQSYFPSYPPAIGVPLDFSVAPEALTISSLPDILLLPSDLASFIKVITVGDQNRAMCMNPGRLAKGIGGGTFLELNYNQDIDNTSASIIRI